MSTRYKKLRRVSGSGRRKIDIIARLGYIPGKKGARHASAAS